MVSFMTRTVFIYGCQVQVLCDQGGGVKTLNGHDYDVKKKKKVKVLYSKCL